MLDIALKGGMIVDPIDGIYQSDLGIKDGKIYSITNKIGSANKEIDITGKMISPGFIDIHMHEDKLKNSSISFEIFNYQALMGVTTSVGGNCGLGPVNMEEYLDVFAKQGGPVNYLGLIGQASLRNKVGCDDNYQSASDEELKEMGRLLQDGLQRGAKGLSFGLEYTPGASTKELLTLCSLTTKFPEKIVSAHYRFDAVRALEAVGEMILAARESGVRFQISHLGSCAALGQMQEALEMIETANEAGVDIMADVYPYDAFSTYVGSAVFDPGCFERWGVDYKSIRVAEGKYKGEYCTKEIFEYLRKKEPQTLVIAFVMDENEVIEALQHPLVMVASDGLLNNGQGHPRAVGTFPRVLGRYVREKDSLDLVSAIKKMTLLPAQRLFLNNKGRLKEGFDADITVFDREQIIDKATFNNPIQISQGIENVFVKGVEVVKGTKLTGRYPGKAIK